MVTYRITVSQRSPLGTSLISGTVWGHLAWAVRYLEGESAFTVWIEEQEGSPWLLSSSMPVRMLPRPLLQPASRRDETLSLEEMKQEKRSRKIAFIPESLFLELRDGMSDETLTQALKRMSSGESRAESLDIPELRTHNHIDRLTGTTPESGGLFFEEVTFPTKKSHFQLFLGAPAPCRERLEALFKFVGESGFGSNASSGNGHLLFSIEEETVLFNGRGTRGLSLSHGILSSNMGNPRYRQHVHFGKLGGDYAKGPLSPFKYPILMARPGATFDLMGDGPFGALLGGVHHDEVLAGLRHHALHLPLRFSEVSA